MQELHDPRAEFARVDLLYTEYISELFQSGFRRADKKGCELMIITILNPVLIEEMMRMKNDGFVRLPMRALQDKRLTMSAAAVLAVVLDRTDGKAAELSAAQIAASAGCSVRTVKSSLKLLQDTGYIVVEHREGYCSRFECPDVLPPKRRWKNVPEGKQNDVSEYECVIGEILR